MLEGYFARVGLRGNVEDAVHSLGIQAQGIIFKLLDNEKYWLPRKILDFRRIRDDATVLRKMYTLDMRCLLIPYGVQIEIGDTVSATGFGEEELQKRFEAVNIETLGRDSAQRLFRRYVHKQVEPQSGGFRKQGSLWIP